jgi:polyhydroxybutyrate depolymerase
VAIGCSSGDGDSGQSAATTPADNTADSARDSDEGGSATDDDTRPATATVATASAGCTSRSPAAPGTTDRTMTSAGTERHFQVIVPDTYDGKTALPVVFTLHPDVIDYRVIPPLVGAIDMAADYDFITVSPSSLVDGTIPWWMAVRIDPPGHDIVFFDDLLDLLESELCVDPSRVYATGMANGAQMAALLGCQLGDRITAVAPLAGPEWPTECDGRPVPVMAFHGDKDPFVSYQDSRGDAREIADRHLWKGNIPAGVTEHPGAERAMANWAAHNGCDPKPEVTEVSAQVVRTSWTGCQADTEFFHIVGGGHTWPGRPVAGMEAVFGSTTMDIDATKLMFEFFFSHHL